MKIWRKALLIIALLSLNSGAEVIFQAADPRGDDYGGGALIYPGHEVYEPGLFDLHRFCVRRGQDDIYFELKFAAVSNPFQAPEGFFHQRIEIYIITDSSGGERSVSLGGHRFEIAAGRGWRVRLAAAPFGESRLYVWEPSEIRVLTRGISARTLDDGKTIQIQVKKELLPQASQRWSYIVLVGAFDGLAPDFWRDSGGGLWQAGGLGPPVFDLLAPRWGPKNQKAQLSKGLLYPLGVRDRYKAAFFSILACGVLLAGGILFWRWIRDGN